MFCGAAIEIDSSSKGIITEKNSSLLHAESAAILNAAKTIADIPDEIDVISRHIRGSMMQLKGSMGLSSISLDVKEVLDALAATAVINENSRKCRDMLGKLKGCEMHTTHLMHNGDEKPLKQLDLNVTTDAKLLFPNADNQ